MAGNADGQKDAAQVAGGLEGAAQSAFSGNQGFLGGVYVEGIVLSVQVAQDGQSSFGNPGCGHATYAFYRRDIVQRGQVIKGQAVFSINRFGRLEVEVYG